MLSSHTRNAKLWVNRGSAVWTSNTSRENYVAHMDLTGDDDLVVLITETRILMVKTRRMRVSWDVPLSTLKSISLETTGLSLQLRDGKPGPFLAISDTSARLWFYRHIERCASTFPFRTDGNVLFRVVTTHNNARSHT